MIFRNARILDASTKMDLERGDLWIESGKIHAIEPPGVIPRNPAIPEKDCSGLWILPGLIDAHVHFREPGFEYKETIESGTQAAAAGGFSAVACMANTRPVHDHPTITRFIRDKAKESGKSRVFPIGAITRGLGGKELAEIGGMIAEGAVAISDDGMPVMNSKLMRQAMEYARSFDVPVISHAEDWHLSECTAMNDGSHSFSQGLHGNPAASEEIMVAREIALCRMTKARVHIAHVSTKLALDHIRRAKAEGLPITAEVTPHHLLLTDSSALGYNTYCKMAPPLRSKEDTEAMIRALADGTIDMIATDHAPHSTLEKATPFAQAPNGIIGIQSVIPLTLSLVHAGQLALMRWVESMTISPARMLGIPHGTLALGREADLCVLDSGKIWDLRNQKNLSKSCNDPFTESHFEFSARGRVEETWVSGVRIFHQRMAE
ncbi:MAG: dihydroorotase [Bdellovibrionales bacterium]|nr:dihydroorotase [Bdellovibrionales bacterium]